MDNGSSSRRQAGSRDKSHNSQATVITKNSLSASATRNYRRLELR